MQKKVIISFYVIVFSMCVSAQVKINSNGSVNVSKDLLVNGVTSGKLTNPKDVTTLPSTNFVDVPENKLIDIIPFLFKANPADGERPNTLTNPIIPIVQKNHYGFLVSNVESVYPEIIETDVSGHKCINYTELIPIMVQAINDLTIRVENLEAELGYNNGTTINPMKSPSNINNIDNVIQQTDVILYQNTPNPFDKRTKIQFSLPEKENNAYIYIFDMQGVLKKQVQADVKNGYVIIEASELEPGMYLYSLICNGLEIATKRMIVSK